MNLPEHSQLGKSSTYVDRYDASLLFPIARAPKRAEIGVQGQPPFFGADLWTAFELSWLNARGKPQVALAHVTVPCESLNIIESKSFKLYLNSFNNTPFASADEVRARLRADITEAVWRGAAEPAVRAESVEAASAGAQQALRQAQGDRLPKVTGASVGVTLVAADLFDREPVHEMDGLSLDRLDIACDRYTPAPDLLTAAFDEQPVTEVLTSNLLKSNCLVTGQPDWGSLQIRYSGPQIEQGGLLQYIVSFRNHNEFHEQCVERIFMDLWTRCKPTQLAVYARYTRRGGLDINPFRTSYPQALPKNIRTARQ
jgi:7-cyano-7-deazaguanine reductase